MSAKSTNRTGWGAHSMIQSAWSLQRVANELGRNDHESESSDTGLFQGKLLACPILLSLATEIALKAWQCSERQAPPDRTHDLLKLFESLKQETQEMLEARMRKVSRWSTNAERMGMRELDRDIQDMFLARTHPLRDVLSNHSDANIRWRFLYERQMETFETGEIDNALTVIIEAYNERRWF